MTRIKEVTYEMIWWKAPHKLSVDVPTKDLLDGLDIELHQGIFQVLSEDEHSLTVFTTLRLFDGAHCGISGVQSIPTSSVVARRPVGYMDAPGDDGDGEDPLETPTAPFDNADRLGPYRNN